MFWMLIILVVIVVWFCCWSWLAFLIMADLINLMWWFLLQGVIFVGGDLSYTFFWKILEFLGFSICSWFDRHLCQKCGWAGSERHVQTHITEPLGLVTTQKSTFYKRWQMEVVCRLTVMFCFGAGKQFSKENLFWCQQHISSCYLVMQRINWSLGHKMLAPKSLVVGLRNQFVMKC